MATYPYVVCDVFTDRALTSNQLAVFTQADEIAEERLQPLAPCRLEREGGDVRFGWMTQPDPVRRAFRR